MFQPLVFISLNKFKQLQIISKQLILEYIFTRIAYFIKAIKIISGPPGVLGIWEKGYLFSGSLGALLIVLRELGSKHILLGI